MAIDDNKEKVETKIADIPIYHIDDLEEKLGDTKVAILTIPGMETDNVTNRLVEQGITGILNFTPARISVPSYVRVHQDRKSTRLNSSHVAISYAVFCLKKKSQQ